VRAKAVVRRRLKLLRTAVALAMFAGLTAALVDFRGFVPPRFGHWLASVQFVPSIVALVTGASVSLAGILIIGVTLAVGRVYCSAICPLGILQDVFARIAAWSRRGKKRLLPYARPLRWLRQLILWGAAAGVAAGWSGLTLALVDPYSNFGRIASGIFRPLVILLNNVVTGPANAIGISRLYRVEPSWAGAGALLLPALLLALLAVLVVLRGRLFCSTLCPVGTFLGLLAQRAAFRLEIDRNACTKCAACLGACKAQCIDLRGGAIDFSRCVACYNCIGACEQGGLGHRFAWRSSQAAPAGASTESTTPAGAHLPDVSSFWSWAVARASRPCLCVRPSDMGKMPMPLKPSTTGKCAAMAVAPDPARRAFIAGTAAAVAVSLGAAPRLLAHGRNDDTLDAGNDAARHPGGDNRSSAICPPGAASIDRFLDRCTACDLCISACPTHVLQPAFIEYGLAGLMKPRMNYSKSFCNYDCRACGEVCPTGAITLLDLAEKRLMQIGEARFEESKCIVKVKGTDCAACSEHCPTKAVNTVPYGNNLRLPKVDRDLCIGCGACEYACPVLPDKAITVAGRRLHGRARKPEEKKAVAPTPDSDFPF
jgi:ferredoxin